MYMFTIGKLQSYHVQVLLQHQIGLNLCHVNLETFTSVPSGVLFQMPQYHKIKQANTISEFSINNATICSQPNSKILNLQTKLQLSFKLSNVDMNTILQTLFIQCKHRRYQRMCYKCRQHVSNKYIDITKLNQTKLPLTLSNKTETCRIITISS